MPSNVDRADLNDAGIVCVTYCPWSYNGRGPAQTCVNLLEHFEDDISPLLVLPRQTKPIPASIKVIQSLSGPAKYLPWALISERGASSLNRIFSKIISETSSTSIAYFWPDPAVGLVEKARRNGMLTIREMINTFRGTAKNILDEAYKRHGLQPAHGITVESVEAERRELSAYDYIISTSPMVHNSLLDAGVDSNRIINSGFGWSPARFGKCKRADRRSGFTALFIGTKCVRKGVLELLAAWEKSNVEGELILAGKVEEVIRPLLQKYSNLKSIRFVEYVEDVERLYRSADVFVFPTYEEGDPQVTYEAAGCGLPVITTPMGAGRIIKHGINGMLVQPGDVEGLAAAIKYLALSHRVRGQMSERAMVDAQQFTYEKIGKERSAKLQTLLQHKKMLESVERH